MFPYGHPDHRPPETAPLPAPGRVDTASLGDAQLVGLVDQLEANQRHLDAVRLDVMGEYGHRGLHEADGAVSPAQALALRHGRDARALRPMVTTAGKLRRLPLMAAAVTAGSVTADHADALAHALSDRTAEAMALDEQRLVRLAHRLGVADYRKAVRYWKAHADPDGTDPGSSTGRELWLSISIDGEGFLKARFDPEAAATVKAALDGVLAELWRGGDPDDRLPPCERRAAAFVELCRRGGAATAEGRPHRCTRPQVVVTIDHDNLVSGVGLAEIETGAAISAGAVRRLACEADIIAAVFGTDSELLDLGRRARLVSPAQRAALVMRDRGCAFPSCDRPAGWCDAHHIEHWLDGGPTDLDNLVLLYSKHHHLLHEGGRALDLDHQGEPVFRTTGGRVLPDRARPPGHPDPWCRPRDRQPPAHGAHTGDDEERAAA